MTWAKSRKGEAEIREASRGQSQSLLDHDNHLGLGGFLFFVCLFVCLIRATLMAYGSSQARGQIGAVAAGLHHSHNGSLTH